MNCPACTGSGKAKSGRDCPACQGNGTVSESRFQAILEIRQSVKVSAAPKKEFLCR